MISVSEIKRLIEEVEERGTLDYKQDLVLETEGDKAQFVKDVISLANSGETAHIIIGVEDGTRRLLGIKSPHQAEQLNQILRDKADPPLRVEYAEKGIMGHTIGVIEIAGENPPYIVAVPDRYGGALSSDPKKSFSIERGTVFVRNYNMNEGAQRADLDKMYQVRYVTLEADLELSHEVTSKASGDSIEADIDFRLRNRGEVVAADATLWIQFKNVKQIVKCAGDWRDISQVNDGIPTVTQLLSVPVMRPIRMRCDGVVVRVDSAVQQIEARIVMGAMNMRTREGPYVISLTET